MRVPKPLRKGDIVALISPAGVTPPDSLAKAVKAIEKMGYKVLVGESCHAHFGYLAGTDELRARDVQQSFENKEVAAIFCTRGGFGAAKILPYLNFEKIAEHPKIFAGYSDITALHLMFNERCNLITYHAPMASIELIHPRLDSYTLKSFKLAMKTHIRPGTFIANPKNEPYQSLNGGVVTGQLTGGNLTLLASSLGTPYEVNTSNKIVFLEDVDESPRQIDRLLTQLQQAGKFDDAAGFLLGNWKNCIPFHTKESFTLQQLWEQFFKPLNKPVLYNVACGHSMPTMTLPLGATIELDANNKTIKIL